MSATALAYRPDELAVTCWCEARIVHVPRRLLLAGATLSCGLRGCIEDPAGGQASDGRS